MENRQSRSALRLLASCAAIVTMSARAPAAGQVADGLTDEEQRTLERAALDADGGEAARAVAAMEALARQHPDNYAVGYELGYTLIANGEYRRAAETFRKLQGHKGCDDRSYQMEGNALDYMGRRGDAMRAYRRGLARFPRSGRLMMEMGNMSLADGDYDTALRLYEQGVEAEPGFASNYYRAAWVLLQSSAAESGLALGEAFLLMEPTGERAETMSRMVCDTYRAMSPRGSATTIRRVAETKRALLALRRGESESATAGARVSAVEDAIVGAGHWTAYCAWLVRKCDADGLSVWMTFNEAAMESFAEWFDANVKNGELRTGRKR